MHWAAGKPSVVQEVVAVGSEKLKVVAISRVYVTSSGTVNVTIVSLKITQYLNHSTRDAVITSTNTSSQYI